MKGFTLIELLIVVVIVGIITAIAVPTYNNYIVKSKVRAAQTDLTTMSLNLENKLQLQMAYPNVSTNSTSETVALFSNVWTPANTTDFIYTVTSTDTAYTVKAAGFGSLTNCILTLDNLGNKTVTTQCKVTSW